MLDKDLHQYRLKQWSSEAYTESEYAIYSSSVKPQRTDTTQVEREVSGLIPSMFDNLTTVSI